MYIFFTCGHMDAYFPERIHVFNSLRLLCNLLYMSSLLLINLGILNIDLSYMLLVPGGDYSVCRCLSVRPSVCQSVRGSFRMIT